VTTFDLEEIPRARADLDAKRVSGKLVGLTIKE